MISDLCQWMIIQSLDESWVANEDFLSWWIIGARSRGEVFVRSISHRKQKTSRQPGTGRNMMVELCELQPVSIIVPRTLMRFWRAASYWYLPWTVSGYSFKRWEGIPKLPASGPSDHLPWPISRPSLEDSACLATGSLKVSVRKV